MDPSLRQLLRIGNKLSLVHERQGQIFCSFLEGKIKSVFEINTAVAYRIGCTWQIRHLCHKLRKDTDKPSWMLKPRGKGRQTLMDDSWDFEGRQILMDDSWDFGAHPGSITSSFRAPPWALFHPGALLFHATERRPMKEGVLAVPWLGPNSGFLHPIGSRTKKRARG